MSNLKKKKKKKGIQSSYRHVHLYLN